MSAEDGDNQSTTTIESTSAERGSDASDPASGLPREAMIGMPFSLLLGSAWKGLTANKMRAILSALGVMIGVFSVVTLVSLGQMGTGSVTNQIGALGVNLLIVTSHPPRSGGITHNLDLEDSRAIMQHLSGLIIRTAPFVASGASIKLRKNANSSTAVGVTPDYLPVNNVEVRAGRFISQQDVDGANEVAVVGPTVVQHLLGNSNLNPLGQRMEINNHTFRIVGVVKGKGTSIGGDADDRIYIPITTAMHRLYNRTNIDMITLQARSPQDIKAAQDGLNALLRKRHHIVKPYDNNDDFSVGNLAQALEILGKVGNVLVMLLGGIGLIALLVGGIGIMNIMLVSVSERTREIGLRKSVGATQSDILFQFLIEAVLISLIGGLMGTALSLPVLAIAAFFFKVSFSFSPWVLALALAFSIGVGVIFGSYPAAKAARQNPIDCLRFE